MTNLAKCHIVLVPALNIQKLHRLIYFLLFEVLVSFLQFHDTDVSLTCGKLSRVSARDLTKIGKFSNSTLTLMQVMLE